MRGALVNVMIFRSEQLTIMRAPGLVVVHEAGREQIPRAEGAHRFLVRVHDTREAVVVRQGGEPAATKLPIEGGIPDAELLGDPTEPGQRTRLLPVFRSVWRAGR